MAYEQSRDGLKAACLEYLTANTEPDIKTVRTSEASAGLVMEYGPGRTGITRVPLDISETAIGKGISHTIKCTYGDANSPCYECINCSEVIPAYQPAAKSHHLRVAAQSLTRLTYPEKLAAAN